MTMHVDRVHRKIKRYQCDICAKQFYHRNVLAAHMRGIHRIRVSSGNSEVGQSQSKMPPILEVEEDDPLVDPNNIFKCAFCDKGYVQYPQLQAHVVASHKVIISDTKDKK